MATKTQPLGDVNPEKEKVWNLLNDAAEARAAFSKASWEQTGEAPDRGPLEAAEGELDSFLSECTDTKMLEVVSREIAARHKVEGTSEGPENQVDALKRYADQKMGDRLSYLAPEQEILLGGDQPLEIPEPSKAALSSLIERATSLRQMEGSEASFSYEHGIPGGAEDAGRTFGGSAERVESTIAGLLEKTTQQDGDWLEQLHDELEAARRKATPRGLGRAAPPPPTQAELTRPYEEQITARVATLQGLD
ncbi:MAG: hypothetical protein ABH851_01735 [Methanobacteriota archaeon]